MLWLKLELWMENSQKVNCHDVMSIGEGRINTKFKQTAAKIKISSDLLENGCTSQFEGTSN